MTSSLNILYPKGAHNRGWLGSGDYLVLILCASVEYTKNAPTSGVHARLAERPIGSYIIGSWAVLRRQVGSRLIRHVYCYGNVSVHVYIHIYICIHVCKYVNVYVSMCVYIYMCMYIHISICIFCGTEVDR